MCNLELPITLYDWTENVLLFREMWINQKQDFCILSSVFQTTNSHLHHQQLSNNLVLEIRSNIFLACYAILVPQNCQVIPQDIFYQTWITSGARTLTIFMAET